MIQFLSKSAAERVLQPGVSICHSVWGTALAGLASSLIVASYLAQEYSAIMLLHPFMIGLSPFSGLLVLLIVSALSCSFLLCEAEQTLAGDEESAFPALDENETAHRQKSRSVFSDVSLYFSPQNTAFLCASL